MDPYPSNRVHLIDEVRGVSILLMVLYHGCYDLVMLWNVDMPVFFSPLVRGCVVFFGGVFVFISGAACCFSRNNFRRGAVCLGLGMALTLITWLFLPEERILFGILHLLGSCMLLFPLAEPLIRRIPAWIGIPVCLALCWATYRTQNGYWLGLALPRGIYQMGWLFWMGFPGSGFRSADYFPLLPWGFCFFAGSFFGRLACERRLPGWVYEMHCPPAAFVGRNTLIIYLLHQPVIYGLLWVVFRLTGTD